MNAGSPAYRWHPTGTRSHYGPPAPGTLLAAQHRAWVVIEVRRDQWPDAEDGRCHVVVVRPARGGQAHHVACSDCTRFDVFPSEHYPVCATCLDPLPCRHVMAERVAASAMERMGQYEVPGICPACGEPVTRRQQSLTWPDNVEVPGGPPVTFHLRAACRWDAQQYEARWVAADPTVRRATLSCPGHVTNHNDDTYACTELDACPGPTARHLSYTACRCPDCHTAGRFGCHPRPDARRVP